MVEYAIDLDQVFSSLADKTRRDILARVLQSPRSIGELADAHTSISFAAIAKHIGVLAEARLVTKKREGRYQMVVANPKAIDAAQGALQAYKALWDNRFNTLEKLLDE